MINNISLTIENDGLLTEKQSSALLWTAVGKTIYETAIIIECSPSTIKSKLSELYETFNVSNKAQLIAQAFARGYLRAINALILTAIISGSPQFNDDLQRARRFKKQGQTNSISINTEDWT